jgi:hypothetical protein
MGRRPRGNGRTQLIMEDRESFNPLGWAIWFTEDVKDKKLDPTDIASITERLTRAYMRGYEQGKSER